MWQDFRYTLKNLDPWLFVHVLPHPMDQHYPIIFSKFVHFILPIHELSSLIIVTYFCLYFLGILMFLCNHPIIKICGCLLGFRKVIVSTYLYSFNLITLIRIRFGSNLSNTLLKTLCYLINNIRFCMAQTTIFGNFTCVLWLLFETTRQFGPQTKMFSSNVIANSM